MSKKTIADAIRQFGPIDDWLISAAEIETIILTQVCRHGLPRIDACRECMPEALLRRQIEILGERQGLSVEDARWVSDRLCDQFLERRR